MKKNRTMKVAALLLALTLMTSCFVGGTFAKYVTTGEKALETARVAKWGVEIAVSADDAFLTEYNEGAVAVGQSSTVDKLVAPGTSGTLFEMTVSGTPEVATDVQISADLELVGWTLADGSVYCPIVFTVGNTTIAWNAEEYDDIEEFEKDVEDIIEAAQRVYAPNDMYNGTIVIEWEWDMGQANDQDTYLGNQAALGNASTISLEMSITIEQTNEMPELS